MDNRIHPAGTGIVRPSPGQEGRGAPAGGTEPREAASFRAVLEEAQNRQVSFSNHALERMERRDIPLTREDLGRLSDGISRAERKGSRETLLLMDGTAFLVNVGTRTVITALNGEQMKEKLFTNIDSAILLTR